MRITWTKSIHELAEAQTPGPFKIGTVTAFDELTWAVVDSRSLVGYTVGPVMMSGKNFCDVAMDRASAKNAKLIKRANERVVRALNAAKPKAAPAPAAPTFDFSTDCYVAIPANHTTGEPGYVVFIHNPCNGGELLEKGFRKARIFVQFLPPESAP